MNGMHPGGAAAHPGMWIAMMVAMMLPSLIPMLSSYRRSVRTKGIQRARIKITPPMGKAAFLAGKDPPGGGGFKTDPADGPENFKNDR